MLDSGAVNTREWLVAPIAHLAPEKIVDDLTAAQAEAAPQGAPHSIAVIVAHMAFWQDWFYDRCVGRATAMPASAAPGWPAVAAGDWPRVRDAFVTRLRQMAEFDADAGAKRVTPAIEFPPLAHYTVHDALIHVATHNSHHLGQIVLLRQLMGAWPPPAGSWTW